MRASQQTDRQAGRQAGQTDILHIATHGYFDPDTDQPGLSMAETMIGSGIALAGVNDPINEKGDGLLTAFEMVNLNLDSTELVVLSACETGKGANHGEGVYGLQRAVRVAGAENLIMSLWKVDDQATQKLMGSVDGPDRPGRRPPPRGCSSGPPGRARPPAAGCQ